MQVFLYRTEICRRGSFQLFQPSNIMNYLWRFAMFPGIVHAARVFRLEALGGWTMACAWSVQPHLTEHLIVDSGKLYPGARSGTNQAFETKQ